MSEELRNDTDNSTAFDANTSRRSSFLRTVALVVISALVATAAAWGLGAFDHYQEPSLSEKKADLINVLSDDELDANTFLADLTEADLSVLGDFVRPVSVLAVRNYTKAEVLELFKQNYPDQVETFEDIPQNIRDQFNEDGILAAPIANGSVNGFLAQDQVIVPTAVLGSVLQSNAEVADKIHVEIKLLANPEVEDDWKTETLFSGSAGELVSDSGIKLDNEHGLTFLVRPEPRVLVDSGEWPYESVSLKEVKASDAVVYGSSARTANAVVGQVIENSGVIVLTGTFGAQDFGMPVFALQDGEPVWIGVIVSIADSHTAVVVSSDVVQTKAIQR